MTRPRYRLARRVPAPPDAVLAAIRDAIAGTRRGDIPPSLQRGVRGVRGKVRGQRFTVALDHSGEGADPTDLAGMVVPADDGGSEVRASVMDGRSAPTAALVLLGIAGVLALAGMEDFAWVLAGFAVLIIVIATFRDAMGLIDRDQAAFLLQWLKAVLDRLAPADPGATLDPVDRVSSPS